MGPGGGRGGRSHASFPLSSPDCSPHIDQLEAMDAIPSSPLPELQAGYAGPLHWPLRQAGHSHSGTVFNQIRLLQLDMQAAHTLCIDLRLRGRSHIQQPAPLHSLLGREREGGRGRGGGAAASPFETNAKNLSTDLVEGGAQVHATRASSGNAGLPDGPLR